ncbi:DUF3152 domain-containing protein [Streptomyces sp. NPDC056291]|uniref:DUF3152 domain-containing protein n=1 Tax=Streptomyces sp. NPDC056291 TaxID=3345772 RepID=UPI0035D5EE70
MGRHSRRGPAPKGRTENTSTGRDDRAPREGYGPRDGHGPHGGPERWDARENRDGAEPWHGPSGRPGPGSGPNPGPIRGPRTASAGPADGGPRFQDRTPRVADGTGTPARGVHRLADGTPARGVPRLPDGTPAGGIPPVRGGHPEPREAGGGWGQLGAHAMNGSGAQGPTAAGLGSSTGLGGSVAPTAASVRTRAPIPRQRRASPPGPRQDYLDAFDEDDDVFTPRPRGDVSTASPSVAPPSAPARQDAVDDGDDSAAHPTGEPVRGTAAKGKTFTTGIAAAAVATVLAVVVAGQVAEDQSGAGALSQSATDQAGPGTADIAGADGEAAPPAPPNVSALTYDQKMSTKYPLSPALKGSGRFDAVPGFAKAPGTGRKYTYRVDVEQGLGLDGEHFAAAVQKTLNDHRSWAHGGARTFERISSGRPDFVITLASPGTTATWCAKSGLDTTVDNVSCDSAATERVMINAYRWAQGSRTYGDEMYVYRQMLINHEVGHRLGYGHVTCDKDGALAPVMQQQTKFLDHDGIHCLPNAWPYPGN